MTGTVKRRALSKRTTSVGRESATCPNLNVFGFLSCRYAYAHDKNLKILRKDFIVYAPLYPTQIFAQ